MTTRYDPGTRTGELAQGGHQHRHRGHGWMMITCCIPMLAIAGILVATGAVGPFFPAAAVGCTLMTATMMGGMNHGGDSKT